MSYRGRQFSLLFAVSAVSFIVNGCGGGNLLQQTAPTMVCAPPKIAPVFRAPFTTGKMGLDVVELPPASNAADSMTAAHRHRASLDHAIQGILHQHNIPGAAVAVMENGRLSFAKAYGYADLAQANTLQPEQRFMIGAAGHQFVAAAILLLAQDGKLLLDEKVGHYLGAVPNTWRNITLRQLLTHTAGLGPQQPDRFAFYQREGLQAMSADDKLAILESFPSASKPGRHFIDSQLGYDALGFVVAKVSGKTYFDFVQERIFQPLGMTSVRKVDANNREPSPVTGYLAKGGLAYPVTFSAGTLHGMSLAATGLEMNVLDMAKWDAALNSDRLLTQASRAQMWQAQVATDEAQQFYGLGWHVHQHGGKKLVSQTGVLTAFTADYRRYPDAGFSVIVFTNKSDNADSLTIAPTITRILRPDWEA